METCITVWHWSNHPRWYDEGLKNTLRMIASAGFTHINWNPDSGSSYWYAKSEIEFIRNCIEEAGLIIKSIHATNGVNRVVEKPFLGIENRKDIHSPQQWQREAAVELLQNRIDLAVALGSPDIVLHIDVRDEFYMDVQAESVFYRPLFKTLDAIQPYCIEKGVKIAVENLFGASATTYLSLFQRLFERYSDDFLGVCFDSGHWELVEPGGVSVLKMFGDRLIATHIHDNHSATDDHLLPYDGRIKWDLVLGAIAKTQYQAPLNLETPYDSYGLREASFYNRAYSVATKLEERLATLRADSN